MTLISNYAYVDLMQLREGRGYSSELRYRCSTHNLEYYVEYVTMDDTYKYHPQLQAQWNCVRDGFPSVHNLRKYVLNHDKLAAAAGYDIIIVTAWLRRSSTGEVVTKWTL